MASPRPTVVIVHRKPWLSEQVQLALTERRIDVVGYADDGADGGGLSIALAPTLLLLEAQLPSMTGCEVARRVTRCCPDTIVTAQVRDPSDRLGLLGAASHRSAATAYSRSSLPPASPTYSPPDRRDAREAAVRHRRLGLGCGPR